MVTRSIAPRQGSDKPLPLGGETFSALQNEVNRIFEDFTAGFGLQPFNKLQERFKSFSPSIDIDEDDKELLVTAELPGLEEKDIDITLTKDQLILKGEKKEEQERKEGKTGRYYERSYGMFERVIPLPAEIEEDNVEARFKKGVLTVKLPKSAEAQNNKKKISVQS